MTEKPESPPRPGISESSRWILFGAALAKPLQLATNVVLARFLAPAGFGVLGLANATAVTLGGIAGLGLGEAASKFMAENFRRDREAAVQIASLIVWSSLLLGTIFFGIAWLVRDLWTPWVLDVALGDTLLALCLLLGFVNLAHVLAVNLFTGIQSFRDVSGLSVMQALLVFLLALPLAYFYGVAGALAGSVLGATVCVAWAATRLRRIDRNLVATPRGMPRARLAEIFHFAFPSWLALLVISPINLFTFSFLASQGGAGELGMFNTANGFKMVVAMLPGLIGAAIGPAIVEEAGRHGRAEAFEKLLDNAFAALAFLTVPLTILLIFLSDIVFLIYGRAYAGSYLLFMPLAAGVAAVVLLTPLHFSLVARNRTWWLLGFTLIKMLVLLALALWWIPGERSSGLAWASFAADLCFAVLVVEVCARTGHAPRKAANIFYKYLAMTLAALALALALPPAWRWALSAPLAAAAALAIIRRHPDVSVWITGAMPGPMRDRARRVLASLAGTPAG